MNDQESHACVHMGPTRLAHAVLIQSNQFMLMTDLSLNVDETNMKSNACVHMGPTTLAHAVLNNQTEFF